MYSKIKNIVDSPFFSKVIIYLIVLNGITMGLETSKTFMQSYGAFTTLFNQIVITIFTIEIALRIYVHRVSFFKDPWSLFDFFVVAISLVPTSSGFEILRVLRVLRLFRLITAVPQMRKIVSALIYIFAIMSTQLFGEKFPLWFGTLGESFYTLFQIMTLESWSMGIVRPVMDVYPYAWIFFVPFIFIVTFVMINLVVAIIVDAMAILNKEEEQNIIDEIQYQDNNLNKEIKELKNEISELKHLLKNHLEK